MDIRRLTDSYAVSPQIAPDDLNAIAEAGFTTVICNRPDDEVPPFLRAAGIAAAAEAAGLTFIDNPFESHAISRHSVDAQRTALAQAKGPVLAYCASGTRSTIVWMFGAASTTPVDELIDAAARAGYPLGAMRDQLERAAQTL